MKKIILGLITLGVLTSCEKEDVEPVDKGNQPPLITKHVQIVINSVQAMDSMKVISGNNFSLTRTVRDNDIDYSCNITRGLYFVNVLGDCNTNKFELIADEPIEIQTNGDVTITYK